MHPYTEATHRHTHSRHFVPSQLSEVPKQSQLLACHLWTLVALPGNGSPRPIPDVPNPICFSGPAPVMWFVVETPWSMLVLSPESPPAEKQVVPPPIFILPMSLLFNLPRGGHRSQHLASLPESPCFRVSLLSGLRSKLRGPGTSPPRDAQRGWPTCRPSESRSLLWGLLWQVFPGLGQLVA